MSERPLRILEPRPVTTGIMTGAGVRLGLASRWTRFLGQAIDAGIASSPMLVIAVISKFTGPIGAPFTTIAGALSVLYLLFRDGFQGQSLAKRWLGTRVVDADTGAPCTLWESFTRNMAMTALGPLDAIFILGDRHQRLGDKIVGTIVVTAD